MNDVNMKNRNIRSLCLAGTVFVFLVILSSCRSMGPKTIPADGFNYNARIALQQNEQILLNIIRLRYGEVPLFLNVSSMINQYGRSAGAEANATNLFGTAAAGAKANGGWYDRPTITYTPMSGQAYSQSLLTPLPPAAIFFLIQSGWSPTRMLRLTLSSINGLKNEIASPPGRRQSDPGFLRLQNLMTKLQHDGIMGMHIGGTEEDPTIDVYFPEQIANDSIRNEVERFKQLLNLNPDLNSFPIRYGLIQENRDEIVVQTHSMLEILFKIGWFVNVPQEHIAEGRTLPTFQTDEGPLIRISTSNNRPDTDFVAINTRDHWFYIDDRDMESKTTFAIVQILLSLARDGSEAVAPLISIGN